jgi:hypothetical protein
VAVLATVIMLYLDGETMVFRNPTGTNHVLSCSRSPLAWLP